MRRSAAYLILLGILILLKAWHLAPARDAPATGSADRVRRRLPRCERRRRMGSARDLQSGRLGSCARMAVGRSIRRVLCHHRGGHHVLRRTRCLAVAELLHLSWVACWPAPLGAGGKYISARALMVAVGCLVIALSLWQIARAVKLV